MGRVAHCGPRNWQNDNVNLTVNLTRRITTLFLQPSEPAGRVGSHGRSHTQRGRWATGLTVRGSTDLPSTARSCLCLEASLRPRTAGTRTRLDSADSRQRAQERIACHGAQRASTRRCFWTR